MTKEQAKAMEGLYLRMHDLLFAYARSIIKEEALAEEAVQETFQVACKKPKQLLNSENPEGWLVNTLKFVLRNMKYQQEQTQRLLSKYLLEYAPSSIFTEDTVRVEVLYGDIADLAEFQLLKAMYIDGHSHLEIAQREGITISACKKRIQRAKETLRKKLKD